MRALKKTSHLLLGLTVLATLVAGCVKKRPDQFAQTQGIDAQKVSEVTSWNHTLTTKQAVYTPNKSVAENSVEISDDLSEQINNFPLVSYTTDSDLLGEDIPLRGKPNTTYQIRYELGDSTLRILKVGKKTDIPSEEWAYAVQLEDGLIGVPLAGYSVSYFDVVNAENEDRERTNTLIEKPVKDPKQASYVRIHRGSREIFSAVQKVDVYPADYFKGEWYYQSTIVQTPTDMESAISRGSMDTQLESVERVLIRLDSRNTMLGVNVNRDVRAGDNDLDEGYVFSIPIEWQEFEASKSGRGNGLKEDTVQRRLEIERPYIKIKFEEHFTPEDAFGSLVGILVQKATGDQKLIDLKMSKDFFSFTLLKANQGLKVRYAFRRYHAKTYQHQRAFFENDRETFGYFASADKVVLTRDFQRKEDLFKTYKMNRFNPETKEIVYHFSKESPAAGNARSGFVRELARYAVHFWDQAFQKAGTNIRVRLDESKDVDLGDLRYNVIHIIDPLTYQGLGGFGPSVADPATGEIISATSNILISPYTEGMASNIRSYIRSSLGDQLLKLQNFNKGTDVGTLNLESPLRGMTDLVVDSKQGFKPLSAHVMTSTGETKEVTGGLTALQEHFLEQVMKARGQGSAKNMNATEKMKAYHNLMHDEVVGMKASQLASIALKNEGLFSGAVSSHLLKRIRTECPAVDELIQKAKDNNGSYSSEEEVGIVEACTRILARTSILTTILHEMGHNFSLAHNFKCSADPGANGENFWTADEIRREFTGLNGTKFPEEFLPANLNPKTSCVMDYMPDDHGVVPVPGKYDIAALRFIYKGEVQKSNGAFQKLYTADKSGRKTWFSIHQVFGGQKGSLKQLAYCSDMDAMLKSDPLCRQHDYGQSPEEIVDTAIGSFWSSMQNSTFSYDRLKAGNLANSPGHRIHYYQQMKRIYDEWRFLVQKFLGPKKGYLEDFDEKSYAEVLKKMEASPQFSAEFKRYKAARDKAVNFMVQVAFMPNKYCLGTTESGKLKAMELSEAIQQVTFFGHEGAIHCSDPAVLDVLKANGIKFVAQVGNSFNNIHFSNAPRALQEAPDVWGVASDRRNAFATIAMRMANSPVHMANGGFFPSMLDEPDVRARITSLLMDRLMNGVNLSSVVKNIDALKGLSAQDATIKMFKNEQPFLLGMIAALPEALRIPGKNADSARRLGLFAVQKTNNPEQAQAVAKQGAAIYQSPQGFFAYAMPSNRVAFAVIKRLQAVTQELKVHESQIDMASVQKATELVAAKFPQNSKFTPLDLMNIFDASNAVAQAEGIDDSGKAIVTQIVAAYQQLLGQGPGQQLMQMMGQYAQMKEGLSQVAQMKAEEITPEMQAKIDEMKNVVPQIEQQLAQADLTEPFKAAELPLNKQEFKAAVEKALQSMNELKQVDKEEIRAHEDVLSGAISIW